jgi:hypothetical protein
LLHLPEPTYYKLYVFPVTQEGEEVTLLVDLGAKNGKRELVA